MSCNEGGGAPWTPTARLDHSQPLNWCSGTAKGSSNAFTSCGSCEDASVASHVRRGQCLTAQVLVNSGLRGRWLPSSSSLTANFVRTAGFAKLRGSPRRSDFRTCTRQRNNLLPNSAGSAYRFAQNLGTCYRTRPSWGRLRRTSTSSTRVKVRLRPGSPGISLSPWRKFKRPWQDSKPARLCPQAVLPRCFGQ